MTGWKNSLKGVKFPLGVKHIAELSCNSPSLMDRSTQRPEATLGQQNWDGEWIQYGADVHGVVLLNVYVRNQLLLCLCMLQVEQLMVIRLSSPLCTKSSVFNQKSVLNSA